MTLNFILKIANLVLVDARVIRFKITCFIYTERKKKCIFWIFKRRTYIESIIFLKPRPWGIKGAQVNFLPSLSPAAKSFTPLQGVYIARYNRAPYRLSEQSNGCFPMSGFNISNLYPLMPTIKFLNKFLLFLLRTRSICTDVIATYMWALTVHEGNQSTKTNYFRR